MEHAGSLNFERYPDGVTMKISVIVSMQYLTIILLFTTLGCDPGRSVAKPQGNANSTEGSKSPLVQQFEEILAADNSQEKLPNGWSVYQIVNGQFKVSLPEGCEIDGDRIGHLALGEPMMMVLWAETEQGENASESIERLSDSYIGTRKLLYEHELTNHPKSFDQGRVFATQERDDEFSLFKILTIGNYAIVQSAGVSKKQLGDKTLNAYFGSIDLLE